MGAAKILVVFYSRTGTDAQNSARACRHSRRRSGGNTREPTPHRLAGLSALGNGSQAHAVRCHIADEPRGKPLRSGPHRHAGVGMVSEFTCSSLPESQRNPTAECRFLLHAGRSRQRKRICADGGTRRQESARNLRNNRACGESGNLRRSTCCICTGSEKHQLVSIFTRRICGKIR